MCFLNDCLKISWNCKFITYPFWICKGWRSILSFGIHAVISPTLMQNKNLSSFYFPPQLPPYSLLLCAANSLRRVAYTHCLLFLSFYPLLSPLQPGFLPNPIPPKLVWQGHQITSIANSNGQFSSPYLISPVRSIWHSLLNILLSLA